MIKRLRRSLNYECVYIQALEIGSRDMSGIGRWIDYRGCRKPHSVRDGLTPRAAYHGFDALSPEHAPMGREPYIAA